MKLAECRDVRELVGGDWREAVAQMAIDASDFECGGYRFIHKDDIDDILADELSSDEYVLGCFNARFIADVTGWPVALIEAAQKGEQYEAIGKGIIDGGHVTELAQAYASADGYGHHFNSWDGSEEEFVNYYAFRI
jgi:hypothetical protein